MPHLPQATTCHVGRAPHPSLPAYRLDIWTVGRTVLSLSHDSSCYLDAAAVLRVVTEACKASRPGQVLYLVRADAPCRPMVRTDLFAFTPGMDDILTAIGRLADALDADSGPVPMRRRKARVAGQAVARVA